jgi:ElaB/YqjD/DUF883 family membrane-anchored ribosome-binding protein
VALSLARASLHALLKHPPKENEMNTSEVTGSTGTDGSAAQSAAAGMARNGGGFMAARRDPESVRSELTHLKSELDNLVSKADTMGEQELFQAHDQIMSQFSSMRHAARGMASQATRQLKTGVDATSGYVKDNPMQSVTVAAAVGLALGMLMSRS